MGINTQVEKLMDLMSGTKDVQDVERFGVNMKVEWECTECGDVVVSDSKETHKMDFCKCGKSACDLEEGYMRTMGSYKRKRRKE